MCNGLPKERKNVGLFLQIPWPQTPFLQIPAFLHQVGKNRLAGQQGRDGMADRMLWIGGKETFGADYIWVLGQETTELLRGKEKSCVEI